MRQLAARARRHVHEGRPRFAASRAEHEQAVQAFGAACAAGDLEALLGVLDPDVVWRSDGGGRVSAFREPQHGAAQVARVAIGFARRAPRSIELTTVNGAPGVVLRDADGILTVMAFAVEGGRITAIDSIRNPDKLRHVRG